jgi:acetyl/propionyl-CoA carboxylase alpha subunit
VAIARFLEAEQMSIFRYKDGSETRELSFSYDNESNCLNIGDRSYPCDSRSVILEGRRVPFWSHRDGDLVSVWLNGEVHRFTVDDPRQRTTSEADSGPSGGTVKAQMPGKVLQVSVKIGDRVEFEQSLLLMESMKMELSLGATVAGTVTAVEVAVGQMVAQGDTLVEIREDEE